MRTDIQAVRVDDDLETALRLLRARGLDHAPVLGRADDAPVVGTVCEKNILRALLRARSDEAGET